MTAHTYALDATWRPLLKDLGLSSANVLRRAGLPDDLLTQPSVRLASADFYRFWEGMQAESGDPLFPLLLCQTIRGESFSPPLFAALCSPNLLVAARRIAHYKTIVAPMRLDVVEDGDTITLALRWFESDPNPPLSLVITELLFFVTLARLGTRERIVPLQVRTTELPTPRAAFDAFLGVRMQQGSAHHLVFRRVDALRPFLTSNEGVWAAFEPELRLRLAELGTTTRMDQRVRAALLEALPSGLVTMDAVASKLAVSRRTLQRRLANEGTSFVDLVRATRESLARHYLQRTDLPVSEIAFLLGFSEPRSFYRAFREWTGRSPDQVRRQRTD
ncbi:MAG: helix-turn-helix domain-containing protein [Gemmatimonadota bacterium]